jgi:hypothetical protein
LFDGKMKVQKALISPTISVHWSLLWQNLALLVRKLRSRFTMPAKHGESRQAVVKGENQTAPLDLAHFPAADVVTNPHPPNIVRRSCLDNGACFIGIHDDAEQPHVRRLRRGGAAYDRGRRWSRRTAAGREQRSFASGRQTIERIRRERVGKTDRRRGWHLSLKFRLSFGSRECNAGKN